MAKKTKSAVANKPDPHAAQVHDRDPNTIEFTYYFHRGDATGVATPARPGELCVTPGSAKEAAVHLWKRNRLFAEFIAECARPAVKPGSAKSALHHVSICLEPREVGLVKKASGFPEQEPFAAILGCVDARAPVELLFAQGFDDLYITRIAGNSLGPDCAGSLHYALHSFAAIEGTLAPDLPKKTLRLMLALGHSDCGAVTAAVNTFLDPDELPGLEGKYLPDGSVTGLLRKIQHPAVAVALDVLPKGSLGTSPHAVKVHRAALIDLAVYLNAAWSAHQLVSLVQQYDWSSPDLAVEVRYGVFDPRDCYVRAGAEHYLFVDHEKPAAPPGRVIDCLAPPPADLHELRKLAAELAEKIRRHSTSKGGMEALAAHYRVASS
jgi:carbonic anhydrase